MNEPATPASLGYRWPAEWETHSATWLAWPHNRETWPHVFHEARAQYAEFVRCVARYEPVHLLAGSHDAYDTASQAVGSLPNVSLHRIATDDSWIRDHGPLFLAHPDAPSALVDFRYNAWGGKYPPYDQDNLVPSRIADTLGIRRFVSDMVLEGGSIETNGQGLLLTTATCLLSATRNPSWDQLRIERELADFLAVRDVIWLNGELAGDDTDGHVDQLARFADFQTVLLVDDPESDLLAQNQQRLMNWCHTTGQELTIHVLPLPGPQWLKGQRLPASYANFYIVNGAVLVPVFDDPRDAIACDILRQAFPSHTIEPVRANYLVAGLGALHCLSQQQPLT